MDKNDNVVKVTFQENDFIQFVEIENLIKEAKPSFDDNFEKEVIKITVKKKRGNFMIKSAIAASLLMGVFSLSILFLKPSPPERSLSVSNEQVIEVLNSIGGREELKIDDILSLLESNQNVISEKLNNYIKYYFGESDEEDFS